MNNVYIVLSMSGTKFSKFLKFFLKSEFTHVSISFDDNIDTLYSFGRKKYYTPWIAGYTEEHPYTGVFDMFNPKCEILKLSLTDKEYNKLKETIEDTAKHADEYGYNFKGIVYTYFKHRQKLDKRFTCTQFVAYSLSESGVPMPLDKDASLVLPEDYYYIVDVKSIYKGRIRDYFELKT